MMPDDLFMRVSEDDICRAGLDSWPKVSERASGLLIADTAGLTVRSQKRCWEKRRAVDHLCTAMDIYAKQERRRQRAPFLYAIHQLSLLLYSQKP